MRNELRRMCSGENNFAKSEEGEGNMFVVDIPDVPSELAQLVLVQTGAEDILRNSQSSLRPTRAAMTLNMV
jgi:hypothetical protein